MKKFIYIGLAACMLMCGGCSSAENKAAEIYELAVFEQQQFNKENALKLYDRVIAEYPDTDAAKKAKTARESILSKGK